MNTKKNILLIFYCILFSLSLCFVLWISGLFNLNFQLSGFNLLYLGVACFSLSYLFFSFHLKKTVFPQIEKNINDLLKFYPKKESEKNTAPLPLSGDPLERLNNEITRIGNDRLKEHEHLTRLENYRKEYLGNVSHELKTPIFNIQGYVSTLIDGGLHDPSINMDYLKRADRSVDRMINIIDDLETISQLESGSMIIDTEKFDILELCIDVTGQLELAASKKGIKLWVNKEHHQSIRVIADKFRIRQVMANLLTNSIKYGSENGETTITFKNNGDTVFITVSDNGIGIEEEHLGRLFERFYRVDKGRSREQGGTGLGLAIVKHILEAHDQNITVTSSVGKGSTFSFSLKKA